MVFHYDDGRWISDRTINGDQRRTKTKVTQTLDKVTVGAWSHKTPTD